MISLGAKPASTVEKKFAHTANVLFKAIEFFHTFNPEVPLGTCPSRSIAKFPLISVNIGCAKLESGRSIGSTATQSSRQRYRGSILASFRSSFSPNCPSPVPRKICMRNDPPDLPEDMTRTSNTPSWLKSEGTTFWIEGSVLIVAPALKASNACVRRRVPLSDLQRFQSR